MQETDKISELCVFCATDNRFVEPLSVTLSTLFSKVNGRTVNLFISLIDVSPQRLEMLLEVCQRDGVNTTAQPFDLQPFAAYPSCDTITLAAYTRLLAPAILPSHWNKVLYLDCDLLTRKDLSELWNTDIDDYALAAVEDPCLRNPQLQLPVDAPYINSGVLLINLDYWRKHRVSERITQFIDQNLAAITFHDQDAINACLYDKTLLLPPTWNVMHSFFLEPSTKLAKLSRNQIRQLRSDPAIVHFTGPTKPWDYSSAHPYQKEWRSAHALTPFASEKRARPSIASFTLRYAKVFGRPIKRGARVAYHLFKAQFRL